MKHSRKLLAGTDAAREVCCRFRSGPQNTPGTWVAILLALLPHASLLLAGTGQATADNRPLQKSKLSDDQLMTLVQQRTFRYFWDGAEAHSGAARERIHLEDPRNLRDRYADYWQENVNHVLMSREHCIQNPGRHAGYGSHCWGLTSSLNSSGEQTPPR